MNRLKLCLWLGLIPLAGCDVVRETNRQQTIAAELDAERTALQQKIKAADAQYGDVKKQQKEYLKVSIELNKELAAAEKQFRESTRAAVGEDARLDEYVKAELQRLKQARKEAGGAIADFLDEEISLREDWVAEYQRRQRP